MALSNYGELKAAVADWLERSDLTARIPDFISLAQAKMYRGIRAPDNRTWLSPPLRVRDMIVRADIAMTDGAGDLPAGWLSFETLRFDGQNGPALKYFPLHVWRDMEDASRPQASEVYAYTIDGRKIYVAPANTGTIKSAHYARFTAMSADTDTDWVLTEAPHIYLYGALMEAGMFLGDPDREASGLSQFSAGIRGLMGAEKDAQFDGSPLVMVSRSIV